MDHDLECEINDVCLVMSLLWHLAIAQLVERRTVECKEAILRSLVRIRFARTFNFFSLFFFLFFSFFFFVIIIACYCTHYVVSYVWKLIIFCVWKFNKQLLMLFSPSEIIFTKYRKCEEQWNPRRDNIARIALNTPILVPGVLLYWYYVHKTHMIFLSSLSSCREGSVAERSKALV